MVADKAGERMAFSAQFLKQIALQSTGLRNTQEKEHVPLGLFTLLFLTSMLILLITSLHIFFKAENSIPWTLHTRVKQSFFFWEGFYLS